MARISDKHGLTNRYRQMGSGKRIVRRGPSRKNLFGAPKRRSQNAAHYMASTDKGTVYTTLIVSAVLICLFLIAIGAWPVLGILYPIFVFPIIIGSVDNGLKKYWNLPNGKWSSPASIGWMILTSFEMIVYFFMNMLVVIGMAKWYILLINVAVYLLLSFWIIKRKNQKINN